MTNKKEMAIILNKAAIYFSKEITPELINAYHLVLKTYARMALADAVMLCVQESSFMPRPNEIIKMLEKYDLERKWQCVEPSTERMYWVLFREDHESTDDISEAECREIFGNEYLGPAKQSKSKIKSSDDLSEWRELYLQSKRS